VQYLLLAAALQSPLGAERDRFRRELAHECKRLAAAEKSGDGCPPARAGGEGRCARSS
jgi:hypothetical protein